MTYIVSGWALNSIRTQSLTRAVVTLVGGVVAQAFLNGDLQIAADEAFVNAVQSYFEEFLKSDRVVALVSSGGSSANDFREVTNRTSVLICTIGTGIIIVFF